MYCLLHDNHQTVTGYIKNKNMAFMCCIDRVFFYFCIELSSYIIGVCIKINTANRTCVTKVLLIWQGKH